MSDRDPVARLNAALEGRYRIGREIGEGGMARVYLAEDVRHRRQVALKVLKPALAAVVGPERLLAEIETTANLNHPNILPLFDSGEADGFVFFVMPYVEDETLRERLDREKQLPVDEVVRIAIEVAEALGHAHRQGVVHRDIKPANILLPDGRPLIADFGIALAASRSGGAGRLTETGTSLGTPHYMSPEQATGDLNVGPAADIYALGCVAYEMLVGEPPYTGSTPQAVLGKIATGQADSVTKHRGSVPAHVHEAIRKALEKVPADPFGSAAELARALDEDGFRYGDAESVFGVEREWMLFRTGQSVTGERGVRDIRGFRPGVDSAAVPLVATAEFAESGPELSPDGRWLAYSSNVTGQEQVYVRPFPEVDSMRIPISVDGGWNPQWAHSGAELFFAEGDERMMVARVETEPEFRVVSIEVLFELQDRFLVPGDFGDDFYDVAPDDQAFLMARPVDAMPREDRRDLVLVQNFLQQLQGGAPE